MAGGIETGTLNHEQAHKRPDNLDPKVNGPFLDDVRAEQEAAYRKARNVKSVKPKKSKSKD